MPAPIIDRIKFAVVNQSTVVDQRSFRLMVRACRTQLRQHVAPAWFRAMPQVTRFSRLEDVPADYMLNVIMDDADQAGALGYHDESPDGRPYSRTFAKTVLDHGGTLRDGANSVSVTLSHELCEAFVNPSINGWCDDGGHGLLCLELCDPVEESSYPITVMDHGYGQVVHVSNFVFGSYFDVQNKTGIYDYCWLLKKPRTMLGGGYQITGTVGNWSQAYGREVPQWKRDTKDFPAARTNRITHGR